MSPRLTLLTLPLSLTLIVPLALAEPPAADESMMGAAKVIEQLSEDRPTARASVDPSDAVAVKLAAAAEAGLSPEQRGERWVEAMEAYLKQPEATRKTLQDVVAAIPEPDAWPTIVERIEARPEPTGVKPATVDQAVRLFVAGLTGDAVVQRERAAKLEASVAKLPRTQRQWIQEQVEAVSSSLEEGAPEAEEVVQQLAQRVAQAKGQQGYGRTPRVDVPDLVKLMGTERARPVLRSLLGEPVLLEVEGDATLGLARSLALEEIERLAVPQWGLAQSLDSMALYEALDRRFGESGKNAEPSPAARNDAGDKADVPGDVSADEPDAASAVKVEVDVEQGIDADALPSAGEELTIEVAGGEIIGGGGNERNGGVMRMFRRMVGAAEVDVEENESRDRTLDYAKSEADRYYLAALIVEGRTDDAAALVKRKAKATSEDEEDAQAFELPYDVLSKLDREGFSEQVYAFLDRMLREDPDLPVWSAYVSLATRTGHTDDMIKLAETSLERKGLSAQHRLRIGRQLAEGLLAADRVDEGLAALRRVAKLAAADGEARDASVAFEAGTSLTRLGRVLDRPELIEEGLHIARQAMASVGGREAYRATWWRTQLAALLAEVGREAQAEAMLVEALREATAPPKRDRWGNVEYDGGSDAGETLIELAGLYHAGGRHDDVLKLLNQAPWWGITDVAQAYEESDTRGTPLGLMAAAALHADGQDERALAVLVPTLQKFDGNDDAYALLLEVAPADKAAAVLDQLAASDRFEERPLIWRAKLMLQAGELAQAEEMIRHAIAVDPSDGEQGRGDRMRAYAVLADILEKKGEAEQAAFYREVVESIRMSEGADRLYAAGLIARAVALYEEALTHFADAYCIQSRLALRLAQMGQMDRAAEHYRKAFELMPDSFGRIESHCFGCEGVFSGHMAQEIAEQTFRSMVQERPDKPQVWYLLGYLRAAQDRDREAMENFQRAVALDPDYLNAWVRIAGLADSPRWRDEAALNLLRLDPLAEHTRPQIEMVTDLPALWRAVAEARVAAPSVPERLMRLDAAADRGAAGEGGDMDEMMSMRRSVRMHGSDDEEEGLTPGLAIAAHRYVQLIEQMMQATMQ